jgi:type I restriction enzyme S subunit
LSKEAVSVATIDEKRGNLPQNLALTTLGEICRTTTGGTPSRKNVKYFNGTIPWLKSGELKNGIINSTEESITEEGLKKGSRIIPRETLLLALYGATVGKLGILGIDAAINQAICAFIVPKMRDQKFLFWYMLHYRRELLNVRKGGAQPNISQGIVNKVPIPLPPLEEHYRIVSR